ncbi:hypothetical protein BN961_03056 [Afipia felis]|uniref:Uncharacterized protein n=1 Tax=Afipia felis TaxID=1035 RepID=A0A090MQH8_AFIFE|nr:hypothetical protein BN961_03056 [Afipia felis]
MHIVFGWELDGSCHPQTANRAAAAIGQPRSSQPERIAMMLTDESAMATAMTGDNNTRNTG